MVESYPTYLFLRLEVSMDIRMSPRYVDLARYEFTIVRGHFFWLGIVAVAFIVVNGSSCSDLVSISCEKLTIIQHYFVNVLFQDAEAIFFLVDECQ